MMKSGVTRIEDIMEKILQPLQERRSIWLYPVGVALFCLAFVFMCWPLLLGQILVREWPLTAQLSFWWHMLIMLICGIAWLFWAGWLFWGAISGSD